MTRLRPLIALCALCAACLSHAATGLVIPRSDLPSLPESISRELFASVDRACDSLRAHGSAPASAGLASRGDPDPALDAALRAIGESVPRPWNADDIADAAVVVLSAAYADVPVPAPILQRLSHVRFRDLSATDAALALLALEAADGAPEGEWNALAARPFAAAHGATPPLGDVLAHALARSFRALDRNGDVPPDVQAYVRHLAPRLDLGYALDRRGTADRDAADPRNLFMAAALASRLPHRLLVANGSGLFPYDWRTHVADRLISAQKYDEKHGYFWMSSGITEDRATAWAVLALRAIAE